MTINTFHNVFTHEEIKQLINFYASLPVSNTKYLPDGRLFRIIKNSEYNLEDQAAFKILNPKLTEILGPHQFTGGHWMDSYSPFCVHIDNISNYNQRGVSVFEAETHKNIGVLIPLCEHEHFKTIFFDCLLDNLDPGYLDKLSNVNNPELSSEFMTLVDHHSDEEYNKIKKIKLDCIVDWKIGDVFSWPRDQLHCSSNFAKYNLNKQAIVLWL